MKNLGSFANQSRQLLQVASMALIGGLAAAAALATFGAAVGLLPWLSFGVSFGEASFEAAGVVTQVAVTLILLSLTLFLPSAWRVTRLEASHRRFAVGMEDVARAYHAAHADDRRGVFRMRSEFDAVRERLSHLREHPDLDGFEPDVLEVAAQMSVQSRRLAEVYSEEKVARARRFLEQRQEEVERSRELIAKAHHSARELKRWTESVELDESVVQSQRDRLEAELQEILPRIGITGEDRDNVLQMPATAAE